MAYTTHPNQLDTRRGLRAGLIGLAVVLVAAVAALGYSVFSHDSEAPPAGVEYPTNDEMRAENMEIRQATGAGVAGAAAVPKAVNFPTIDEMRSENMEIREQTAAANAGTAASASDPAASDPFEDQLIRPTKEAR